jgi:alkylhydroperoxidase family enzyme
MTVAVASDRVVAWLLAGDPAIRWQVRRDLLHESPASVGRERRKVATEGWGARLLGFQDPEGTWAQAMYSPKWISTTYTMLLLRDLGLPVDHPRAAAACRLLIDRGIYRDGGIGYGFGSETCVTGMVLSILSSFAVDDERLDTVVAHLLGKQMADGGWNCEHRRYGATHASMHTTILVLEGLLGYERHRAREARNLTAVRAAQRRGREFLLQHHLFRSHRSGEVIKRDFVRLAYPPQWHFDVLRGLDYFRASEASRDRRLGDAVELLRRKRRHDGRWALEHRYKGRYWFQLETIRRPSRWNTLRARRVLDWWEGDAPPRSAASSR